MDMVKMDLTGAMASLSKNGFNKYDQMTHFVSNAEEFITFFESIGFTPSVEIGREYFNSTGVQTFGQSSDADINYLLENNVEEVERWFNRRKDNILKTFMDIAFSSMGRFRSIMGRSRWNADARGDDYLITISDILDKEDPLAELSVVGVLDVKEGFKQSDKEQQGTYTYNHCQASRAVSSEIKSKLYHLIHSSGVEKAQSQRIVFAVLRLLFGGVEKYSNDFLESVLKREFGIRRGNPTTDVNKLISGNDINELWWCVGHDTKKENPDMFNGAMFIINMMVLSTLLQGETIVPKKPSDCDQPVSTRSC